jgi:hypothetical protein
MPKDGRVNRMGNKDYMKRFGFLPFGDWLLATRKWMSGYEISIGSACPKSN